VYGALLVKMFLSVATIMIYALVAKKDVNKPAIFICMALYFIYTILEVRMIFRLLKQQKKNDG
jgi:archaellum biogenesis protein FlaJ (TadC family)